MQKEHAGKVEHVVPDAGALKECSNAEQPVLRAYPAGIPADGWQMLLSVWRVP